MWTDGNGFFYVGDCRHGDRAATSAEVAAWRAANTPVPSYTFLQFMAFFTSAEQTAFVNSTDPQIKLFLLMASGVGPTGIQLNNAEVIAGISYAVSVNIITSARATAILAGQTPT